MASSTIKSKKAAPKKPDKSLESWIWDAACSIRGAKDAPKYKDCILPLVFTKRPGLDDAETYRPIAEIVEELKVIETEARKSTRLSVKSSSNSEFNRRFRR
jgi:type I restriction-modification system DNA methylase subunit